MTGTPPPSTGSFRLTPRFWIVLGIAIVLIVAVVLAGVLYARSANSGASASADENNRPVPSETPAASAAPTPTPTPTVDPADTRPRPTECSQLFSAAVTDQIPESIELNPAWSLEDPDAIRYGTNDPELLAILDSTERLKCGWLNSSGAGDIGLTTSFAWVSAEQQQAASDQLHGLGYDCYEELGGERCVIDTTSDEFDSGESHFLREGVWIASSWTDLAPDGYTHDIIANTFG